MTPPSLSARTLHGLPCRGAGGSSPRIALLGSPLFGACFFDEVLRRLHRRVPACALEPRGLWIDPDPIDRLHRWVSAFDEPPALLAHGLALPLVRALPDQHRIPLLVLTNGPVSRLGPVSRALARAVRLPGTGPVFAGLSHPRLAVPALASPLGLPRTVVNPYVMERPEVEALLAPALGAAPLRRALFRHLARWGRKLPEPAPRSGPVQVIWATADPLHPLYEARQLELFYHRVMNVTVPRSRWLFPQERPWFLADQVALPRGG